MILSSYDGDRLAMLLTMFVLQLMRNIEVVGSDFPAFTQPSKLFQ